MFDVRCTGMLSTRITIIGGGRREGVQDGLQGLISDLFAWGLTVFSPIGNYFKINRSGKIKIIHAKVK